VESFFAGLLGAVIGATASIATVWIQGRFQERRDRMRLVMELALEEYKSKIELIKFTGQSAALPPVALFLHYHHELAKLLEKDAVSPATLEALAKSTHELDAALDRLQASRASA